MGRPDGWLFQVNASKSPPRYENHSGLRVFFHAGSICSQEMRFLLKRYDMHVQLSPPSPPQPPVVSLPGSPLCGHFVLAHAVVVKLESLFPVFPCPPIASHMSRRSRAMPSLGLGQMSLVAVTATRCLIFPVLPEGRKQVVELIIKRQQEDKKESEYRLFPLLSIRVVALNLFTGSLGLFYSLGSAWAVVKKSEVDMATAPWCCS